jgi:hypothetical protein
VHFTVTQAKTEELPECWSGRRIDEKMLMENLEPATMYDYKNYVLVCGPPGLNEKAKGLL